jgi:hypothetical protein
MKDSKEPWFKGNGCFKMRLPFLPHSPYPRPAYLLVLKVPNLQFHDLQE